MPKRTLTRNVLRPLQDIARLTLPLTLSTLGLLRGPAVALAPITETDNGTTYSITFVTNSYSNAETNIQKSETWGNQTLATQLAALVGADGSPNGIGPYFAYAYISLANRQVQVEEYQSAEGGVLSQNIPHEVTETYAITAIATPIPWSHQGNAQFIPLCSVLALGVMRTVKKFQKVKVER